MIASLWKKERVCYAWMSKNGSAGSLLNFISLKYGSGARSLSLKGDLAAPSQKVFSSAMNGDRMPDFAQYVNVSTEAVLANNTENFLVVMEVDSSWISLALMFCKSLTFPVSGIAGSEFSMTRSLPLLLFSKVVLLKSLRRFRLRVLLFL